MDPKLAQAALDALLNDDKDAAAEILKKMLVAGAAGAAPDGAPPPAELGATGENAETPPEEKEMAALSRELVTLSGRATAGEAAAYFRGLHTASVATSADRAALEASERRGLVGELVKLGAEFPHTAWTDKDAAGDARVPVKRLSDEPIAELRSRVAAHRTARGESAPATGARPPVTPPPGKQPVKLTRDELAGCKRLGITPEEFAERKAEAATRSN